MSWSCVRLNHKGKTTAQRAARFLRPILLNGSSIDDFPCALEAKVIMTAGQEAGVHRCITANDAGRAVT